MAAVSPVARAQGVAPLTAPADDAFAQLYARHARQVHGFCLKWLRSPEEAEDAVQTTFMHAWRGLGRGIVPTSESAWVLAIARNVCRSASDARRRRSAEVARDPHVLEDSVAAPSSREDEVTALAAALSELTEQQRRAIVLREWHGLSYREISDELGLSQAAVETLLFRARRSLARKLRRVPTFAPWMKSLIGGSAAKIAAGATIAAVAVSAGEVVSHPAAHHALPRPTAAAAAVEHAGNARREVRRASEPSRTRARAVVRRTGAPTRSRATAAPATSPAAATVSPQAPAAAQAAPSAHEPDGNDSPPAPSRQATAPAASAGPAAPTVTPDPPAPVDPTGTVAATVGSVTDTANGVVDTAAGTVGDVANTAVGTATNAASTVTNTAQSAVSTVVNTLPVMPPAPQTPPLPKLLP